MSKLERAYIDTADQTWKKVEDKNGVTRHFKDGTPVSENSFNGGTANVKYEGQKAKIAIPSDKGPGYTRKEVNPIEASHLGKELRLFRDDVQGEPLQQVSIAGGVYDTSELADLNKKIVNMHGPDAVMTY